MYTLFEIDYYGKSHSVGESDNLAEAKKQANKASKSQIRENRKECDGMEKSIHDAMLGKIMDLVCEIEIKQKQWRESPLYDGCYAEDVFGMIKAINIVTGKKWRFVGDRLKPYEE